jgi:hypothetical protein
LIFIFKFSPQALDIKWKFSTDEEGTDCNEKVLFLLIPDRHFLVPSAFLKKKYFPTKRDFKSHIFSARCFTIQARIFF